MNTNEKRVRRLAQRFGLALAKSRVRSGEALSFGGYMLVDPLLNTVVVGSTPYPYSLSLDEAEHWLRVA